MRRAFFIAMLLTLVRDRAALVMAFVLPAAFFVIFALIFVGASGGDITVRLAISDEQASDASTRFVEGLIDHAQIEALGAGAFTSAEVKSLVRDDAADVGVVVRGGGRDLGDFSGEGTAPIEIVSDPTREIPTSVVRGIVQQVYFAELTDIVIEAASGAPLPEGAPAPEPLDFGRMIEQTTAVADTGVAPAVSYYAGAVAAMFLLFSALNGAITLVTERESGLIDRVATGPGVSGRPGHRSGHHHLSRCLDRFWRGRDLQRPLLGGDDRHFCSCRCGLGARIRVDLQHSCCDSTRCTHA